MNWTSLTPAQWLDRMLPPEPLPLLTMDKAVQGRPFRLALPKGEVLLRSVRVPRGFSGDAADFIRAQIPKLSAWPEADCAWIEDAQESGFFHVAISAKGRADEILARVPDAESVEAGGITLAQRRRRERRIEFLIRRLSVVVIALSLVGSVAAVAMGFAWRMAGQEKLAEVARLLPSSAGAGDAGFLLSRIERKLAGPSSLADLQALTTGLPDGAWLTSLEWQPGKLRAAGLSDSVDGLLEAVQAQARLGSVSFAAPVSRSDDGHYRFTLEAKP